MACLLAAAAVGSLVWLDVLPGGWRVRTWLGLEEARVARERQQHRAERLDAFDQEGPRDVDVLAIGSSTIERGGPGFLAEAGRTVAQRGIGDEPLALLEERFAATLRATKPETILLYAASVDARRPTGPDGTWRSIPDLALGVGRLVDLAAEAQPGVQVLLLEVLPETEAHPERTPRIRALNGALGALAADRPHVSWVRTWRRPLVDDVTGSLVDAFAADRIHLAPQGYSIVQRWIEDALAQASESTSERSAR